MAIIFLGLFIFGITYGWSRMNPLQRSVAGVFGGVVYSLIILEMKPMFVYILAETNAPGWLGWVVFGFVTLMVAMLMFNLSKNLQTQLNRSDTNERKK